VDIASTAESAFKLWEAKQYDLIFMDIGLPDMDGYELTKQIRLHEHARGTYVPIIALTAHVDIDNKQYVEAGMDTILAKPLVANKTQEMLDLFIPTKKKSKK
jgi:two-component system aerobic respiration control sensor histidine kinase ArcB